MFEKVKVKSISVVTILANLYRIILMEKETRALLRSSFLQQKCKQEISSRLRDVASLQSMA